MKVSKTLIYLSIAVAVLAVIYAGAGLFVEDGGESFVFTTVRGDTVEMYGHGVYRYDTAFKAPIWRGTDAFTLFIGVPLLLFAVAWYRRGSLRGNILLVSMLSYFLYTSASLVFGAAYNNLLLVYIVSFSSSLFAFILGFMAIDLDLLAVRISERLPRRGIAVFLFLGGASVLVWLLDIVFALIEGGVPSTLGPYTTEPTYGIDLGVILPSAYLAGILVWRRLPLGILLAAVIITLNASIGLVVVCQSIMQAVNGVVLSIGEYATYAAPFVILSLIAIGFVVSIHQSIKEI